MIYTKLTSIDKAEILSNMTKENTACCEICGEPSEGEFMDITGVSYDLCDDCIPPEDCMSVKDWISLTHEQQQEIISKINNDPA